MLKLINREEPRVIEVEETKIYLIQIDNGQRVDLATHMTKLEQGTEAGYNSIWALLSPYISEIEGIAKDKESIETALRNIENVKSQRYIIDEILGATQLCKDEAKN